MLRILPTVFERIDDLIGKRPEERYFDRRDDGCTSDGCVPLDDRILAVS